MTTKPVVTDLHAEVTQKRQDRSKDQIRCPFPGAGCVHTCRRDHMASHFESFHPTVTFKLSTRHDAAAVGMHTVVNLFRKRKESEANAAGEFLPLLAHCCSLPTVLLFLSYVLVCAQQKQNLRPSSPRPPARVLPAPPVRTLRNCLSGFRQVETDRHYLQAQCGTPTAGSTRYRRGSQTS